MEHGQHMRHSKGMATVEVAVLFGVAVAALAALAIYVQRGLAGGLKGNADSLGVQFSTADGWNVHARSATREEGSAGGSLTRSAQFTKSCQGVGEEANPGCAPADPDAAAGRFDFPALPCPDGSTTAVGEPC